MNYADFYIFGVIDACGETVQAVCDDPSDIIQIHADVVGGGRDTFESDAYHLKAWAESHGLKHFKHGYKFAQLGEPWKVYED